jgi:hypothetical protein
MPKPIPTNKIAAAALRRKEAGVGNTGATRETPHIASAITIATTGGGILTSSDVMYFMRRSFAEDSPSFPPGARNSVRHPYTKIRNHGAIERYPATHGK